MYLQLCREGTNATGLDDIQLINKLEISKSTKYILKLAKSHQSSLIQLNKKLKFYSFLKQDNKKSSYLARSHKKHKSRRTMARFRASNLKLMIEYGRYTLRAVGFSYAKRERNHCEQPSAFPSSMRELVTPHVMHLMPSSFVNNFFAGSVSVQKNQTVSHQNR